MTGKKYSKPITQNIVFTLIQLLYPTPFSCGKKYGAIKQAVSKNLY